MDCFQKKKANGLEIPIKDDLFPSLPKSNPQKVANKGKPNEVKKENVKQQEGNTSSPPANSAPKKQKAKQTEKIVDDVSNDDDYANMDWV